MLNLKEYNKALIASLLLLLAAPVYLSFFVHPIADDYVYANVSLGSPFFEECLHQYLTWNGRYISNIFVLLNPLIAGGLKVYQLIPVLLLMLTLFSFYVFTSAITNQAMSKTQCLIISLSLTILYLFQMPSLAEGYYWYTGAITYQTANALTLLYIALLLRYVNNDIFISKIVHWLLLVILLFVTIGFNETILLVMVALHSVFFILSYVRKNIRKRMWISLLVVTGLASLLVILAPGNSYRASLFPESHNLIRSMGFTLLQMCRFFFDWISNLPFILLSFLYIPLSLKLSKTVDLFKNSFYISPKVFPLFLFILLFIGIFPAYWNTNILGQHRTVNTAYFFFIIIWFMNLTVWSNYAIEKKIISHFDIPRKLSIILFCLVLFAFAFTKNGYKMTIDIFYGKAKAFDEEMRMRNNVMKDAKLKGETTVWLGPLKNKPESLFVLDLSAESGHWINSSYGTYFGIKNVELKNK